MIRNSETNDILLADGNRDDVDLTLRVFEKAGVRNRITVVHDGFETLDHLFENGRNGGVAPGLVMLDLKLSRLSGLDVIRRVRANELTRRLPVIVLISSEDHREVLENYGLKADGYICKPVDFVRLRDEISKLDFDWLVEDVS
ncbi:MAG: response regulator [Rubrobacteraceae bacterium]